jgi:hypothetical protein
LQKDKLEALLLEGIESSAPAEMTPQDWDDICREEIGAQKEQIRGLEHQNQDLPAAGTVGGVSGVGGEPHSSPAAY